MSKSHPGPLRCDGGGGCIVAREKTDIRFQGQSDPGERDGEGVGPMHPTVKGFLEYQRSERNASIHTIRSYEADLGLFCRFLEETQGEGADPTTADARRLRRYSAWLNGQGYASSTI